LLAMERPLGVELLVRAAWNRRVADSPHRSLWESLRDAQEAGTVEIRVPRQSGRAPRTCCLSVRHQPITLKPPQSRKWLGEVSLWGIRATEISPPDEEAPIEWLLLTTVPPPISTRPSNGSTGRAVDG
jgi:hypothetical protein